MASASSPPSEEWATCRLTGDRLFRAASSCDVVEDGLLLCVRGTLDVAAFADDPSASLTATDELPVRLIDVVHEAGLHHITLDRPSFIKHWRRYLLSVERALLREGDTERAEWLSSRGHLFARTLLQRFDECEFLLTTSEDPRGA